MIKRKDSGVRLTMYVTLDMLCNFSVSQFSHWESGDNGTSLTVLLPINTCKIFKIVPGLACVKG